MKTWLFAVLLTTISPFGHSAPAAFLGEAPQTGPGFFTIQNASNTESFMNHHYNEDLYVFVVAVHTLPNNTIYWDFEQADYVLDPGESLTLTASGKEDYIIRLGYSPKAVDWKWQRRLTAATRVIESFWD